MATNIQNQLHRRLILPSNCRGCGRLCKGDREFCTKECKEKKNRLRRAKRRTEVKDRRCAREECGKEFRSARQQQLYCTSLCANAMRKAKWRKENPPSGLPTPTTGAIAELIVSVDLMKRGFSVFRAMSSACHCDLAVLKNRRLCRVEVKTVYRGVSGKPVRPECDGDKFDVLAMVLPGEIIYDPSIDEWFK